MRTILADRKMPNTGGWQDRHDTAIHFPSALKERAMVNMLTGWAEYAQEHQRRYDSVVGDDGGLGPEWEAIGDALRGLLNGETGRLDCGTLDGFILDTMKENGVNTEEK